MSILIKNPRGDGSPQTGGNPYASQGDILAPAFRPQILRSIRMHPVLTAIVSFSTLLILLAFATLQRPAYQAEVLLTEEPTSSKLIGDSSSNSFDAARYDSLLQEQMQMMQRTDTISEALNSLPEPTWNSFGDNLESASNNIQGQLKVARVTTSYQVAMDLKGPDPVKVTAIVNAIAKAYLDKLKRLSLNDSDQRAQLLQEERQRIERELQSDRTEQIALGTSLGIANPGAEAANPYDADLAGIRVQLVEARAAHDAAAAQLAALSGQGTGHNSALASAADELIAGDSGLNAMKSTISGRRATLSGQMADMTPDNPIYKQDQDEIADLDRTLETMTVDLRDKAERRLQDKLRADLARTGDVEARINGQLARQISVATGAAPKLQRATELAGDIQRLIARETAVDDTLRGLQLEANGPSSARLSFAATVPTSPEKSRRRLILIAALPVSLFFGALAAVLARKRDRRIFTGKDVEETLGFPVIAVLPLRTDVSEQVLEEYVLRLAAGIESAYRAGGAKTFVLTPVTPSTDIGPLTSRLQRKFEQIGLDAATATSADLLEPVEAVSEGFAGHETELVRPHSVPYGSFVNANLAAITASHELVLIKALPLTNSAETEYIARSADATIIVIESGLTTFNALIEAAALLQRLQVKGVGAVLDGLDLRFADVSFKDAIWAIEGRPKTPLRSRRVIDVEAPIPTSAEASENIVLETNHPSSLVTPATVVVATGSTPAELTDAMVNGKLQLEVSEPPQTSPAPPVVTLTTAPQMPDSLETVHQTATNSDIPAEAVATAASSLLSTTYIEPLLHEKMTSMQTIGSASTSSYGVSDLRPSRNWLQRLLKREDEPAVSIIPDDDHEHALPPQLIPRRPATSYDLPPERLEQISRSRPVAVTVPADCEPETPGRLKLSAIPSAEVQAVESATPVEMLEPIEQSPSRQIADYSLDLPLQNVHQESEDTEHHGGGQTSLTPISIDTESEHRIFDTIPGVVNEASYPVVPRPLSFHELLRQKSQHVEESTAPVDEPVGVGVQVEEYETPMAPVTENLQVAIDPLFVPESIAQTESLHSHDTATYEATTGHHSFNLPGDLNQWPNQHGQASLKQASAEPTAFSNELPTNTETKYASSAESLQPESVQSGVLQPSLAELRAEPAPAFTTQYAEERYRSDESAFSGSQQREEVPQPSRIGRWNRIPPLRPTQSSRLESSLGSSQPVEGRAPTADPWAALNEPVQRLPMRDQWAQTSTSPDPHEREVILTRQWGLLSRFQQANGLASGSRQRLRVNEEDNDSEQTTSSNGSNNGNQ